MAQERSLEELQDDLARYEADARYWEQQRDDPDHEFFRNRAIGFAQGVQEELWERGVRE